jgi:hypothetical protein
VWIGWVGRIAAPGPVEIGEHTSAPFYPGGVRTSPGLRAVLAVAEVACGVVLLFTA